jgi:hypothetical protein
MSHARLGVAATLFLLFATPAAATVNIQYTLIPLGGDLYRYVYTITNSPGSSPAELFDILFDTSLYSETSLQIVTPTNLHADWSEQLLGSLPGIPAAYDVLSLKGGVAGGTFVTGFSVQFRWLGAGVPGAQPFKVYNATNFQLLQSGSTSGVLAVPAASTFSLLTLAFGVVLIVWAQRRAYDPFGLKRRSSKS